MTDNKTIIKKFQYKGQQVNYFNKVVKNSKIECAFAYFDAKLGCHVVQYTYK